MSDRKGAAVILLAGAIVAALLVPSVAGAAHGRDSFSGGTPRERSEVVRALDASTFDWGVVRPRITIHIDRGTPSRATSGEIWLDANLLEAGRFAWGVVQHEYAHEVDFFVLTAAARAFLLAQLGGSSWCAEGLIPHSELGCERFASTLAWAYWPSADNCMRPALKGPTSRMRFRHLLARLIANAEGVS
jgi:hypothetical protein